MRGNKGITLVALIVTITVMLILLGVSLTFVFNEDGLIDDAQKTTEHVQKQINKQNQWTQNIIDEF